MTYFKVLSQGRNKKKKKNLAISGLWAEISTRLCLQYKADYTTTWHTGNKVMSCR